MSKHYFALLGLSEPKVFDSTIAADVPFKLSEAEFDYIIEEQIGDRIPTVIAEARIFFAKIAPTGKMYFKRSRWMPTAKLYSLNIKVAIDELGCRHETPSDKSQSNEQLPEFLQNSYIP